MSTTVLTVEGLRVSADNASGRAVVDGVSLSINQGETLCLVGESGSGKSVTSFAVMGLLPKDSLFASGSIRLEGEELIGIPPRRLRALRAESMAMVFQEPMTALNPVATVGDQIDEVLRLRIAISAAERRERVLDMLREVHLPDVERIYGSFPHQLSGGQRQRIVIAMALVLRPRLLICDEPTTALDVTTQKQILALLKELQNSRGTAILFITHDMGVVSEIADRVAVMRNGALVECGPLMQVLSQPKEQYTRNLLQSVPSLRPRLPRANSSGIAALEISGLTKTYKTKSLLGRVREVRAASDINFVLHKGRTLGVVGESGSGKSTVARCAIRLIDPTDGKICLVGADISTLSGARLKPHRQNIQVIFQDPYRSLNPRMRIGESIIEGPTSFGVPRAKALQDAGDWLELVGLPADAIARFPHQFSGGQRQRIAIARALAMKPQVLVADEAVSALDVSVQAQVLLLLDKIQRELGLGILFITHDLRVAAQICDDIIVMKSGRAVEQGTAQEVLANPKAEYTRRLIAAAPGRQWDFANFRPLLGVEAVEAVAHSAQVAV
jgi:ABC-type glutathione transport system ATPase component